MVNLLQKIGGPVAVALTPFIVNAGQVGAESISIKEPSPTFPENSPVLVVESNKQRASLPTSSPTNPTPERKDIVNLSKASPFSLTRMPIDVSQVAQRDGQTSNNAPIVPPPNLGRYDAGQIADLQQDINQNNSQLVQGLQKHNESQSRRLQEILNRTKN
jgi:hypothetical protein